MPSGVRTLEEMSSVHLAHLRNELVAARRQRRGVARVAGEPGPRPSGRLSPATVNYHLRGITAFLHDLRRLGYLPQLDRERIGEGLRRVKEPRPLPALLRPKEIADLLDAALRYDQATFALTRLEKDGLKQAGTTPRYRPVAPLALAVLLTGGRIGELLSLEWSSVLLSPPDDGEIIVTTAASKTSHARAIDLSLCPTLIALLSALKLRADRAKYVFGGPAPLPRHDAENARRRLIKTFGAPRFSWQRLRQTTASYLANAPGIFGGASAFRSAAQLGHSVTVAERNYVGLIRNIPKAAETLEAAMKIEAQAAQIVRAVGGALPESGAPGQRGEAESVAGQPASRSAWPIPVETRNSLA